MPLHRSFFSTFHVQQLPLHLLNLMVEARSHALNMGHVRCSQRGTFWKPATIPPRLAASEPLQKVWL